jgi:hypothetical protein
MRFDQSYTVVCHEGHGLTILRAGALAALRAEAKSLPKSSSKPTIKLMTGAEIASFVAAQRLENARDQVVRQINGSRPQQGQRQDRGRNRREQVLRVIRRSSAALTQFEVREITGLSSTAVCDILKYHFDLGLVAKQTDSRPYRFSITDAGRKQLADWS